MRLPTALALAILLLPALSGCAVLDRFSRPDYDVARTPVLEGDAGWNTDPAFTVQVNEPAPVEVRIEATPANGAKLTRTASSQAGSSVTLEIPDGTWTIEYWVGGHKWETFRGARFDSTPPQAVGLETIGQAPQGTYTLGASATLEPGASVQVVEQATGRTVATSLPVPLAGLADGVHAYDVVLADRAGNTAAYTVQVVAGSATQLPAGSFTMGIVARYTTAAALWDITDLAGYLSPAAARSAMPGHTGAGRGITPDHPEVQAVVRSEVGAGMTTGEAALALYRWMFDELEYDERRLEEQGLLEPDETMDAGGGVCRDLAALYVSLLRASGVPSRLVTGYLGGRVGGFHAWVEFYGGTGHGPSPWVPVDVSGIDGPYDDVAMLQAFGVRQPEYLMMRALTTAQEQGDWSSAATLAYSTPQGSPPPDAPFDESLDVVAETKRTLCIDEASRLRQLQARPQDCDTPAFLRDFVAQSVRVLDYGIRLQSAAPGTNLTLGLVYPDVADTSAERVEFSYYAPPGSEGCRLDAAAGRAFCEMDR